jgi:2-oxoglutarate ferredoxin oxidoreductase subunit alpha
MEDEIASICAIIGGSVAGKKTMTATSGPGYSLMQEALGYAMIAEIPCVIVTVMRGGPSTGLPTKVSQGDVMQARWGAHGDHAIIALTASNIQDVFDITVEAFNMAEEYRTPVVLLFDEIVGHMREKLVIPAKGEKKVTNRLYTKVPDDQPYHPYRPNAEGKYPMADFGGTHRYNMTGLFHNEHGFPTENEQIVVETLNRIVGKIEGKRMEIARWKEFFLDDCDTLLVSYGSAARTSLQYAADARKKGLKVGLLELQTIWPLPEELIREKAAKAKSVVVVEMNMGQLTNVIKAVVNRSDRVFLANRIDGTLVTPGDIDAVVRAVGMEG